jgi:hypothetical protein
VTKNSGLLVGAGIGLCAWSLLLTAALARGRAIPWFSISYNLPITLAFASLCSHMAQRAIALGRREAITAYGPIALVWLAGAILLFMRLVTKSIDVSGHMSWALLMGVQCFVERLPIWFTGFVWLIAAHVLFLKIFVLGGYSGQYGLLAGGVLGATLWLSTRHYWAGRSHGSR